MQRPYVRVRRSAVLILAVMALVGALPSTVAPAGAATTVFYVDLTKTAGANDGSTWKDAFLDLQSALAVAKSGDQIWVADGVYFPNSVREDISFKPSSGQQLYGGFLGLDTEVSLQQRNPAANVTTLSGEINGAGNSDNSRHVVETSGESGIRIDGFTITEGYADAAAPDNDGAAVKAVGSTDLLLANVTIKANTAINNGGGLLIDGGSAKIISSRISNNAAQDNGGGISVTGSATVQIVNTILYENTADLGGGVDIASGTIDIIGSTIVDNDAISTGGGIRNAGGTLTIANSIMWDNFAPTNPEIDGSATVSFSDVEGGVAGTNNINVNPLFTSAATDDYTLHLSSPAREAGNDAAALTDTFDIDDDGNTTEKTPDGNRADRIQYETVDLGAFETQFSCPGGQFLRVDESATGTGTGSSWANAFTQARDAFTTASNCAGIIEIQLAQGDYTPHPHDRTKSFELLSNVTVTGGYAPGGSPTSNPGLYISALSGDLLGGDPTTTANPALSARQDNSYRVVSAGSSVTGSLIRNLTIRGGNADNLAGHSDGAGLVNIGGDLLVQNVIIELNGVLGDGGGLLVLSAGADEGSTEIQSSTIRKNRALRGSGVMRLGGQLTISDSVIDSNSGLDSLPTQGGGLHIGNSSTLISRTTISNNSSEYGGGIYLASGSPVVTNSQVVDNSGFNGGGVYASASSTAQIYNSLIARNSAASGGGVYARDTGAPTIIGATITANTASIGGGVSSPNPGGNVHLQNSIVWGNTASLSPGLAGNTINFDVSFSDAEGWSTSPGFGPGNVDVDPLFVDVPSGNYRLGDSSPVLNLASNSIAVLDTNDVDYDGNTTEPAPDLDIKRRIAQLRVDMGAYERQLDQLTVLPTPCAIYDSTTALGTGLSGPFAPNETRTVKVTGQLLSGQGVGTGVCVPVDASAVVFTISAIDPQGAGNLRLSEFGVVPTGGVVNYISNGLNNANTVTVPLGSSGRADITANAAGTHVRLVALGYYSDSPGLDYFPLTPCAVADSRSAQPPFAGLFSGGSSFPDIDVVGTFSSDQGGGQTDCGVPGTADAVVVNLVAVGVTGGTGFLSAAPAGTNPFEPITPFAPIGLNNATSAIIPLNGESISIDIDTLTGSPALHVRAVVLGYLDETEGSGYTPLNPCAAFDSRPPADGGGGTPGGIWVGKRLAQTATTYKVTDNFSSLQGGSGTMCGVPSGASAVLINLVGIQAEATGNFRAYATGTTPTGGVLNFSLVSPAMNNSNAVVVPVSTSGEIDLYTNAPNNAGNPTVHARGIILGYFS